MPSSSSLRDDCQEVVPAGWEVGVSLGGLECRQGTGWGRGINRGGSVQMQQLLII